MAATFAPGLLAAQSDVAQAAGVEIPKCRPPPLAVLPGQEPVKPRAAPESASGQKDRIGPSKADDDGNRNSCRQKHDTLTCSRHGRRNRCPPAAITAGGLRKTSGSRTDRMCNRGAGQKIRKRVLDVAAREKMKMQEMASLRDKDDPLPFHTLQSLRNVGRVLC
jgi:hypothetical protein